MLAAIHDFPSRTDHDGRMFTAVVIVLGALPCLLLMIVLFAK
jgi:hypothetical protein